MRRLSSDEIEEGEGEEGGERGLCEKFDREERTERILSLSLSPKLPETTREYNQASRDSGELDSR